MAELVDALELKIEFRKKCPFNSGQGHQFKSNHLTRRPRTSTGALALEDAASRNAMNVPLVFAPKT